MPHGFLNFGTDLDLGPKLELEMDLIFAMFTAFTITLYKSIDEEIDRLSLNSSE